MIIDKNDPTGLGLFSRCARNQAAKSKVANSHASRRSATVSHISKDKNHSPVGYLSKHQSRESRERKFKAEETPAVGQYHISVQSRPKLIWNFFKQKSNQRYKTSQPDRGQIEMSHMSTTSVKEGLSKSQCSVNMSRMVGRKGIIPENPPQQLDLDVKKSIQYVKSKIVRSIVFDKAERQPDRPASSVYYNCNYDAVKQRKNGIVAFARLRGREPPRRYARRDNERSHAHYDYDSYVWQGNSRVYLNTKTHLISFKSQTDRSISPK